MHLIEILLPLTRRDGSPQPAERFAQVRAELVERFGGVTAFTRAPAEGLWDDGGRERCNRCGEEDAVRHWRYSLMMLAA
jgi:hypothetical protein